MMKSRGVLCVCNVHVFCSNRGGSRAQSEYGVRTPYSDHRISYRTHRIVVKRNNMRKLV